MIRKILEEKMKADELVRKKIISLIKKFTFQQIQNNNNNYKKSNNIITQKI